MRYTKERLSKLMDDKYLSRYRGVIENRIRKAGETEYRLTNGNISLMDFASGHEYFGLHKLKDCWVFREWAPNAKDMYIIGDFSNWQELPEFRVQKIDIIRGIWEIKIPLDKIYHKQLYKLKIYWDGGSGERLPAYCRRVVQDDETKIFSAQVWAPKEPYIWEVPNYNPPKEAPIIYEAHIGMAQEKEGIGTYDEFRVNILPSIIKGGYNTIQLMAIMEHPYYGSFGYHVSNFFAASFRFGTPEDLKRLIDEAHKNGITVIMDLVHSHAVKNELEGLSRFDGTEYQYFHAGDRGIHRAWDSRCFDYGKIEVLHFLLSNCRYWLDEYKFDGFRFDGITSMLYYDHGLGTDFSGYDHYFDDSVDEDAVVYLILANRLIHSLNREAITIAEDVSGMPGLAALQEELGIGFDYRLALGVPDFWFDLVKNVPDENWFMDHMFFSLTNKRSDELTVSYVECHDQAIVGSKTMAFELMDANMYEHMDNADHDIVVERGIALHKMIRLITIGTAGGGYLNFMGNEFGHPEWIDFPREENNWSYKYAKRQWSLRDNGFLKYKKLGNFDDVMVNTIRKHHTIEYPIEKCYIHNEDKVIAFKRGELLFIFNFHPSCSYSDYFITVPDGKYDLLFSTDQKEFGGFDLIEREQEFFSKRRKENEDVGIFIYIPSRTAMVLIKNNGK